MKNQYFGDVNDYRKYGLLRSLQAAGFQKLLVAWMLTPDDGSQDGGFRSYLASPKRWSGYDADLFTGLQRLRPGEPSAKKLESFEATGLLPGAAFYSAIVPDRLPAREEWREGLLARAQGMDLVFVDPDNGIEVSSAPIGKKNSSKYVAWNELEALWSRGCSLLIYQHLPRERRGEFAARLARKLAERTGARRVEVFSTPYVLFLCAVQERHESLWLAACATLAQQWTGEITLMDLTLQEAPAQALSPEPPRYLEPTQEAGRALFTRGLTGPVVMLNLLRFREVADYSKWPDLAPAEPISGEAAYARYVDHTLPFLRDSGGEVVFLGKGGAFLIGPSEERWDAAMLVRQRSLADFLAFASDVAYLAGMGHREAALEDSRLLPLVETTAVE